MTTVLVAGTANTTGMNVVRALIAAGADVIGCDCASVNAADMLCVNHVIPRTTDPGYIDALLKIVDGNRVTRVIPSNDHDVRAITANRSEFDACGVVVNGLGKNTLACLDKLETSHLFSLYMVRTPELVSSMRYEDMPPFVLRARLVGGSAKFTHVVRDPTLKAQRVIPPDHWRDGVATRFVAGSEFTVDVLCDQLSEPLVVVPRLRRQVSRLGDVHHAELVMNNTVIADAAHAARMLRLVGINCLQCILDDHGKTWFFEVNPRPGSGIDLTTHGGVNMPKLWLDVLDGRKPVVSEPNWGLQMVRYAAARFFR